MNSAKIDYSKELAAIIMASDTPGELIDLLLRYADLMREAKSEVQP